MLSGSALFFSLFNNLALFVSLVAVYGALSAADLRPGGGGRGGTRRQLVLGLVFGLFALGCMNVTIPVAPGVRVDQRNAVVALSGAFGGPLSAVLTGSLAAVYRWHLSGAGVLSGVTGIGLAATAGTLLHRRRAPFGDPLRGLGSAALATAVILPGFLLAGAWPEGLWLMLRMAVPYGLAILLAISLGGLFLDRQERHAEAAARFRQMVAESPDALLVVDRARRIRLFNAKAEAYSGRRVGDAVGRTLAELGWLSGALDAQLARAQAADARLPPWEIEDAVTGNVFEVLVAPVLSRTGGAEWMLTLRDVTERRRAEAARADYEARILESRSLEALGRLAGGVAHDFNNMLSVIIGTAEVMRAQAPLDEVAREDLDNLSAAAQRASDLTAQLLAFGRRQVLEPCPVDPNAAVTALVPLLQRLLPENIELSVRLDPGVPRAQADPTQLDQVLINLAANARDAMPRGGRLTIETRAEVLSADDGTRLPDVPAGRYVVFGVTDTGVGMSEAVRTRVFEPFFTTKEHGKGTGLGLATVHGIARQSGGTVTVASEPGQGSCFRVYLPATEQPPAPAPPARRAPALQRGGRVLLVEDSDLVRAPVRRMLAGLGFDVTEAASGAQALASLQGSPRPFDLLLTDVVMRDLAGPELAIRLRELQPGLRVLFMSGYTESAVGHGGLLDPAFNFLAKPFTLERLRSALDRVLA